MSEFVIENKKLIKYTGNAKHVVIPDSITEIGAYAFSKCSFLHSVYIGDSVEIIDCAAFYNCCNLVKVRLSKNLKSIEAWAFSDCNSLVSVSYHDYGAKKAIELPRLMHLGANIFQYCDQLTRIFIPNSLQSVSSFEETPFEDSSIVDLHWGGTQQEWEAISFDRRENVCTTIYDVFEDQCIHFNWKEGQYSVIKCDNQNIHISPIASVVLKTITYDKYEEECSLDFEIENESPKELLFYINEIRVIDNRWDFPFREEIISDLSNSVRVPAYTKKSFTATSNDADLDILSFCPNTFLEKIGERIKCSYFFLTCKVKTTEEYSYENLLCVNAESINVYDSARVDFTNDDILYIYKGNIKCHKYSHDIIQATAVLHSKSDNEIELNVEYCTDCEKFLLEYTLFEEYRSKYGALIGNLRMVVNGNFDGEYDLALESPLKLSGYSVSQKDGFTAKERHYILARIMHDKIMSKGEVIRYLSYFIRMNGAKPGNELAVTKWREDLNFVQKYDINTQPKAIISDIRKY